MKPQTLSSTLRRKRPEPLLFLIPEAWHRAGLPMLDTSQFAVPTMTIVRPKTVADKSATRWSSSRRLRGTAGSSSNRLVSATACSVSAAAISRALSTARSRRSRANPRSIGFSTRARSLYRSSSREPKNEPSFRTRSEWKSHAPTSGWKVMQCSDPSAGSISSQSTNEKSLVCPVSECERNA